jgi:phosphoribosyl-AMP cyclohydrolase
LFASSDNWEDIKKYYLGCFINLPNSDKLFFVDNVTSEGIFGKCEGDSASSPKENVMIDFSGEFSEEPGYFIKCPLPQKRWFLYKNRAYYISRIPKKQWKKGISPENTTALYLLGDGNFLTTSLSADLLRAYANSPLPTKTEASYPLSDRFVVSASGHLFVDLLYIGHVYSDHIIVKNTFEQEMAEFFPRHRITTL